MRSRGDGDGGRRLGNRGGVRFRWALRTSDFHMQPAGRTKDGMESGATRDATSEKHHRRNDGKISRPQAEIEEHKAKQRRMVSATNEEKRSRLLRRGHKQARIGPRNMHVTRWRMVRQNCRWTGRKHEKAWMTEA